MKKDRQTMISAVTAGCAVLLSVGNLMIVKALQPQLLSSAIVHIMGGIVIVPSVYLAGRSRILKVASYFLGFELIWLLFCPVLGAKINGASRWMRMGQFAFAPAMLTMPMLTLFWSQIREKAGSDWSAKHWRMLIAVTLIVAGLVVIEPFFSMAGLLILLGTILFLLSGGGWSWKKNFITLTAVLIAGTALIALAMNGQQLARQKDFYDNLFAPDYKTQYHTWSTLTTLKYSVFCGRHQVPAEPEYLIPNAVTDSALIAGCGEYGYIFLAAALFLITVITVCGVIIARSCEDHTGRMLAGGMTAVIALPALFNTLMMFGVIPMGGVSFPFLAYGGTAMFANALALGGLLTAGKKSPEATI